MAEFRTKRLPAGRDVVAPDGCDVRVLLELAVGGMAHFALGPRQTSTAVDHRTAEEIWLLGQEPLAAVAVTTPPWPGEGEATVVPGKWPPTVP